MGYNVNGAGSSNLKFVAAVEVDVATIYVEALKFIIVGIALNGNLRANLYSEVVVEIIGYRNVVYQHLGDKAASLLAEVKLHSIIDIGIVGHNVNFVAINHVDAV